MLTPEETIELKQLQQRLQPEPPTLDEKDHALANARYAFDSLMWDYIYDLMLYVVMKEGLGDEFTSDKQLIEFIGNEKITSRAISTLRYLAKTMAEDEPGEPWDAFGSKHLRESIYASHGGDCTAIAATCERCWAEAQYKLPWSADWDGKSEGHKLYYRAVTLEKKLVDSEE